MLLVLTKVENLAFWQNSSLKYLVTTKFWMLYSISNVRLLLIGSCPIKS